MRELYYAGIGSRDCPEYILELIEKIGLWLSEKGYILRSGGADGCDLAFERGCDLVKGKKEIFIPWKGFNGSKSNLIVFKKDAFELARKYHPNYEYLKQGAKKLQARNSHQILGWDLKTPSSFVICYTRKGMGSGGTGQAIRIAIENNIPVFDFGKYINIEECRASFQKFANMYI